MAGKIKKLTTVSVFHKADLNSTWSFCILEKTGKATPPTADANDEGGILESEFAREKIPSSIAENNFPITI